MDSTESNPSNDSNNKTDQYYSILAMYSLPNIQDQLNIWWKAIRIECLQLGLLNAPISVTVNENEKPDNSKLFLGQTCGFPLLINPMDYKVVCIPRYGVQGAINHYYSGLFLVSSECHIDSFRDFTNKTIAINSRTSLSGCLLPASTIGRDIMQTMAVVYTGSHYESMFAVSNHLADVCCVDCVSYALYMKHRPESIQQLRILSQSFYAPSLPYVTSSSHSDEFVSQLQLAIHRAYLKCNSKISDLKLKDFTFASHKSLFDIYDLFVKSLQFTAQYDANRFISPHDDQSQKETSCLVKDIPPKLEESSMKELLEPKLSIHLAYIETVLMETLSVSSQSNGDRFAPVQKLLPDGRLITMYFPIGLDQTYHLLTSDDGSSFSSNDIELVCFIGTRVRVEECDMNDVSIIERCWFISEKLASTIDPKFIACYVSMELSPGGDWGNLIIFNPGYNADSLYSVVDGSNEWTKLHLQSHQEVAPWYYSTVTIHHMTFNFMKSTEERFQMKKTLFLQYEDDHPTPKLEQQLVPDHQGKLFFDLITTLQANLKDLATSSGGVEVTKVAMTIEDLYEDSRIDMQLPLPIDYMKVLTDVSTTNVKRHRKKSKFVLNWIDSWTNQSHAFRNLCFGQSKSIQNELNSNSTPAQHGLIHHPLLSIRSRILLESYWAAVESRMDILIMKINDEKVAIVENNEHATGLHPLNYSLTDSTSEKVLHIADGESNLMESEEVFDVTLHLALPPMTDFDDAKYAIKHLNDLGYDPSIISSRPSNFVQSECFPILSARGLFQLRKSLNVLVNEKNYSQSSPRIPKVLRGAACRSRFIRDLSRSVELTQYLSLIAKCGLVPHPMQIMHGHTNLLYTGKDRGHESVDKWHRDTVAFVLVIFVSDPDCYEGGQFQYVNCTNQQAESILQKGEPLSADYIKNVGVQYAGYGVFQQGCMVYHRAAPVTNTFTTISNGKNVERTTFVLSFVAANVNCVDACYRLSETYNEIDPAIILLSDWTRFRCWKAQRLLLLWLRSVQQRLPITTFEGLPLTYVISWMKYASHSRYYLLAVVKSLKFTDEKCHLVTRLNQCLEPLQKIMNGHDELQKNHTSEVLHDLLNFSSTSNLINETMRTVINTVDDIQQFELSKSQMVYYS